METNDFSTKSPRVLFRVGRIPLVYSHVSTILCDPILAGSYKDCLVALQSFGIPAQLLPLVDKNGVIEGEKEVTTKYWGQLLERLRHQERAKFRQTQVSCSTSSYPLLRVGVPAKFDVLLGRGRGSHEYPGNVRFRELLEAHEEEYDAASTEAKTQISKDIVNAIVDSGGRFLNKPNNKTESPVFGGENSSGVCWLEVEPKVAWRKTAHAFRTMRKKRQANNEEMIDSPPDLRSMLNMASLPNQPLSLDTLF